MPTKFQPAPDAVLHLVKCGCVKERCLNNRCQCRKAGLNCTDLCSCNDANDETCENVGDDSDDKGNDDSSDDDEEVSDNEDDDE